MFRHGTGLFFVRLTNAGVHRALPDIQEEEEPIRATKRKKVSIYEILLLLTDAGNTVLQQGNHQFGSQDTAPRKDDFRGQEHSNGTKPTGYARPGLPINIVRNG